MRRILFLGYNRNTTSLIAFIESHGFSVVSTDEKVDEIDAEFAISFGYRHILKGRCLDGPPIYNLHMSFLPWNRGAHPNFWAHIDGTPSGVTIHLIDEGIDTGQIVAQERVFKFPQNCATFSETYTYLFNRLESLFKKTWPQIETGSVLTHPQVRGGTFHKVSDLPEDVNWNADIREYLAEHSNSLRDRSRS